MASEQEVYVGDLPQLGEILPGDFLFIITPTGEYILDFKNFIIGEDNISFAQRLNDFDTSIIDLSAAIISLQDSSSVYSANFQSLCSELASVSATLLADVVYVSASLTADVNYLSTALVTTSAALAAYSRSVTATFTPYFAYLSYGITLAGISPVSPAVKYTDYNVNSVVASYDPANFLLTLVVNFTNAKDSINYMSLPTFTGTAGSGGLNTIVREVSCVKATASTTFYVGFSANASGVLNFDALFI